MDQCKRERCQSYVNSFLDFSVKRLAAAYTLEPHFFQAVELDLQLRPGRSGNLEPVVKGVLRVFRRIWGRVKIKGQVDWPLLLDQRSNLPIIEKEARFNALLRVKHVTSINQP